MKNKLVRLADVFIIAVVLISAGIFLIWKNSGSDKTIAEISVNGEIIETVDLDSVKEKITIIPDTEPAVVITAENGKIRFESAECSDKICVSAGELYRKGDTAVCLPAKTVITVTGSDLDALTY